MRDKDAPSDELTSSEDTDHILKRRRKLQARSLGRWRKLLLAGAATGVAFGTLTCRAQVCLSQVAGLQCSVAGTNYPLEQLTDVTAQWVETSPGIFSVSLTAQIDLTGIEHGDNLTFSGSPQLVDATLDQETVEAHVLTLSCTPGGGTANIEVLLPLDCGSYADAVHVLLDVSADPADGQSIGVTWLD